MNNANNHQNLQINKMFTTLMNLVVELSDCKKILQLQEHKIANKDQMMHGTIQHLRRMITHEQRRIEIKQ